MQLLPRSPAAGPLSGRVVFLVRMASSIISGVHLKRQLRRASAQRRDGVGDVVSALSRRSATSPCFMGVGGRAIKHSFQVRLHDTQGTSIFFLKIHNVTLMKNSKKKKNCLYIHALEILPLFLNLQLE